VPAPVRVGRPGPGYPWSWSVCPWLPGDVAAVRPPDDPIETAAALGAFVAALHEPAPADAPANPSRGVPLADRSKALVGALARLAGSDEIDVEGIRRCWSEALEVPRWAGPPIWLHGDLHPANLLVHEGRVAGVLDFGDLTAGDPATDLAVAWMLLPPGARPALRAAAGDVDDDTWARARGWALALGVAIVANSADHPALDRVGRRTLAAVLDDPDRPRRPRGRR
jgi:aminoglycoside phosphotransferase (APT) family kinase protein